MTKPITIQCGPYILQYLTIQIVQSAFSYHQNSKESPNICLGSIKSNSKITDKTTQSNPSY